MLQSRGRTRVSVPEEVLRQELPGDEVVALNLDTEQYHGLDPVGARMWQVLAATGDVEDALQQLLEEYDVQPEVLRADLDRFVDELVARGLLLVHGG